jgi:hypothetical protein
VSAVLDQFGYLERDFGYRVDGVFLHFRGSHVRFAGPVFDLVVSYDPEDTGRVYAELWVREDMASEVDHPRTVSLNAILAARQPSLVLPDTRRPHLERSEVLDAISVWSSAIRAYAPDVLRGLWPGGSSSAHLK